MFVKELNFFDHWNVELAQSPFYGTCSVALRSQTTTRWFNTVSILSQGCRSVKPWTATRSVTSRARSWWRLWSASLKAAAPPHRTSCQIVFLISACLLFFVGGRWREGGACNVNLSGKCYVFTLFCTGSPGNLFTENNELKVCWVFISKLF